MKYEELYEELEAMDTCEVLRWKPRHPELMHSVVMSVCAYAKKKKRIFRTYIHKSMLYITRIE